MRFEDFAAAHGLLLKHVEFGRWVRVATTDKPCHKNGSYKHMGDVAFIQNHATMPDVACWFPEGENDIKIDRAEIARIQANANRQIEKNRQDAARKAEKIMQQSRFEQHAYLDSKGFPDSKGLVYRPDESTNLLVIPMRVGKQVIGCQMIDRDGTKKFLFGQRCAGAEYRIGDSGVDIWCEGYATGLDISYVMAVLKIRYCVHICFSAGNMQSMAKAAGRGFVVADNDISQTGEKAAKATDLSYFLPPVGDFNDFRRQVGLFRASQELRKFLADNKKR